MLLTPARLPALRFPFSAFRSGLLKVQLQEFLQELFVRDPRLPAVGGEDGLVELLVGLPKWQIIDTNYYRCAGFSSRVLRAFGRLVSRMPKNAGYYSN